MGPLTNKILRILSQKGKSRKGIALSQEKVEKNSDIGMKGSESIPNGMEKVGAEISTYLGRENINNLSRPNSAPPKIEINSDRNLISELVLSPDGQTTQRGDSQMGEIANAIEVEQVGNLTERIENSENSGELVGVPTISSSTSLLNLA